MDTHEIYIQRCLQLAKNGLGSTYPNPMVGSVVVHNIKIIGEGWHQKAGQAHAEVIAIQSVKNRELLKESTLYVNLEPCSHFGKTPPCADLIIKHQIPKVVIGTVDPNPEVGGKGIQKLRNAGIEVVHHILPQQCDALNRRFFTFHRKQRPYIILKWAQSQDGFLAPLHKDQNRPVWISNTLSRQLVHKWRSEEQAILIGSQTALDDEPSLTTRDWFGPNPVRIVLDSRNRVPTSSPCRDSQAVTHVFSDTTSVEEILKNCYDLGLQSVIVEGGRQTLQSFIDSGIWDQARIFVGNLYIKEGIPAPLLSQPFESTGIGNDVLRIYNTTLEAM